MSGMFTSTVRRIGRALLPTWHRAGLVQEWSNYLRTLGVAQNKALAQPFARNATVYAGTMALADIVASLPFLLNDGPIINGKIDRPLTSGPAFELLSNPAPQTSWRAFVRDLVVDEIDSGEAHVFDPQHNVRPRALVIASGREMTPRKRLGTNLVLWWDYSALGASVIDKILPEEDGYLRLPNPYDRVRGLSPLAAAALNIRQTYSGQLFNARALENGAKPSGNYVTEQNFSPEERDEFLKVMREKEDAEGEGINRPLFLSGGIKYEGVAFKNTDLELIPGMKLNALETLQVIGTPPVLAGIFESAHYDVADQAIRICILHKVTPLCRSIEDLFNLQILPRVQPGAQLLIDVWEHPVMQALLWDKVDVAVKLRDLGTPYNEIVRAVRLPLAPLPWGERSIVPAGMSSVEDVLAGMTPAAETPVPADQMPAVVPTTEPGADGQEKEGPGAYGQEKEGPGAYASGSVQAASAAAQRIEEGQIRAAMPKIKRAFSGYFARVRREYLERLRKALRQGDTVTRGHGDAEKEASPGPRVSASPPLRVSPGLFEHEDRALTHPAQIAAEPMSEAEAERVAERVMLRITVEAEKLRAMVKRYWPEAERKTLVDELVRQLGISEEEAGRTADRLLRGNLATHALRVKESKISGIAVYTQREIKARMIVGLRAGEDYPALARRIQEVTDFDMPRALRIARAEASQAVSTARYLADVAAGAPAKWWLTGANPRATHVAAGVDYPRGAPIGAAEFFHVGDDWLLYPRDPSGSAGEIINCNCTRVAAAGRGQASKADMETRRRGDAGNAKRTAA